MLKVMGLAVQMHGLSHYCGIYCLCTLRRCRNTTSDWQDEEKDEPHDLGYTSSQMTIWKFMSSGFLPDASDIRFSPDVVQPKCCMRNISFPDIWHTKGRLFCYYNLSTGLVNRLISIKFLHLAIKKALLSKQPVLWALRERFLVLKKACEDGGMSWAGDLKDHLMETL